MVEQRRYNRTRLEHPIEFASKSDDFLLRLDAVGRDISLGGMFIETDTPALLGDQIMIYLTLPRATREMALPATVRWERQDGMGVQFGLLGAVDTYDITAFVKAATASDSG